jgi:hypothetical protein
MQGSIFRACLSCGRHYEVLPGRMEPKVTLDGMSEEVHANCIESQWTVCPECLVKVFSFLTGPENTIRRGMGLPYAAHR